MKLWKQQIAEEYRCGDIMNVCVKHVITGAVPDRLRQPPKAAATGKRAVDFFATFQSRGPLWDSDSDNDEAR